IKFKEGDTINEAAFVDLVKKAVALNAKGTKITDAKPERKALVVPPELEAVLKKDPTAWANWQGFPYSHKKEYIEWVTDGKKEETRKRRIAQALEMIREGMQQGDKYQLK
ncbi:MAG TPA: YdeI/OmpD-associated family protein, partial [Flavobacteriales bacterium]|nr:YdeI/OmpD-associated family protein [Flavobacteriales bacterium]